MDQSPSLDDCLKLLKGERDEQRLAGLLLVTKFCKGDDHASIRLVYDAVGPRFLDRLLRTGMGKGAISSSGGDNRDAYLQLSVTVLAAFCRVPAIAASEEMVSKIPLIVEIMPESCSSLLEECFEFLFLVSTASEDGVTALYESGGINMLASQMAALPDGSHSLELALKLVQLMISKVSLDKINNEYPSELAMMVTTMAKQFAVLHNAQKFELLHLLSAILSSKYSAPLHGALLSMSSNNWSAYMRVGVVAILNNRVAPAEKLQALILAESMVSMLGETWLIGQKIDLPDIKVSIPADRCLLLVLETSRVEIAVLLNEIAYLKYEASKNLSNAESIVLKQRNLAVAFSLVEKIIKLISNADVIEGDLISESTFTKLITGLNETISVVLEYLQDAKDHRQKKGDDLLASVRVIGSYLAETPVASEEKVRGLLDYMLSVEGEDEPSPFYSLCFLLPMLCQITMKVEGCKALVSCGGHKAVVECLVKLIAQNGYTIEGNDCIFLACDTIMNLLLKRDQVRFQLDEDTVLYLLKALANWTGDIDDSSVIMMASSICSLVFDYTSEEALLNHPNFESSTFDSLSQLIVRSLASCGQDICDDGKNDMDLLEIVTTGYSRWSDRFPCIKEAIKR